MSNVDDQERLEPAALAELLASGSDPAVERLLSGAHPADLAEALDHIEDLGAKLRLFTTLDAETASRVLRDASESARAFLLTALPDARLTSILEHLETDDAADLVGGLPEERRATLLQRTDAETRREVAELLTYPADTAGGIMKAEVPAVSIGTSARDVVDYLRRNAEKLSDVWDVFIVDGERRVVGRLPLRRLVLADDRQRVDDVMEREVVSVWSGTTGQLDDVPLEDIRRFDGEFLEYLGRSHPEVFDAIRTTTDLSDDTISVLESSIADFKKQYTTIAGTLLVNDEPVAAVADEDIDPTQIKRAVRG